MVRDLSELMTEVVEADARASGPVELDAQRLHGVTGRIKRRRTVRHTVQALVAVPVVAGVVAVAWFALPRLEGPAPAVTPTPSEVAPTPGPSPSASEPEDNASDDDAPDGADVLGLPPFVEAPEGLLATTTAGWVLDVHRPVLEASDGTSTVLANDVFVTDPDGTRYRILTLPDDMYVYFLRWQPGSTRVAAQVGTYGDRLIIDDVKTGWIDLTTGTFTSNLAPWGSYLGRSAAGADVWIGGGKVRETSVGSELNTVSIPGYEGAAVLDAQGTTLAAIDPSETGVSGGYWRADLATGDVSTVTFTDPQLRCQLLDLADDGSILAACDPAAGGPEQGDFVPDGVYRVGVDGEAELLAPLALDQVPVFEVPAARLGDGRLVLTPYETEVCTSELLIWDGTELSTLTVPGGGEASVARADTWDGQVFAQLLPGCAFGDARPGTPLVRVDLDTGATVEISPVPTVEEGTLWEGLQSWVVATD